MIFNSNKKEILFRISVLFWAVFFFGAANFSAQTADAHEAIKRPHLSNHKFVTSPYISSPFVNTRFVNSLGFGTAIDLYVPIIYIDGEPMAGLRGDVSFLTLEFEYQYAVNDWLGMFGKAGMITRFGTEAQSLIAQGLNASYGMELGWLFNVVKTDDLMISLTANLWNRSGTVMNLFDFVREIIDSSGLTEDNALLYSHDYIQGGGGIRFAWAVNKYVGLNALVEAAYGESIDDITKNEVYYKAGVAADFDWKSVNENVPVGFSLGIIADTFMSSNDNSVEGNAYIAYWRIAYTGRNDILISLDLSYSSLPVETMPQNTLKTVTSLLTLEYFF